MSTSFASAGRLYKNHFSVAVAVSLLLSVFIQYTTVSSNVGYLTVLSIYILSLSAFFIYFNENVNVKKPYLFLFLLLAVTATISTIINSSVADSIRLVGLLFFTAANLFIIPYIISYRHYYHIIGRISAIIVIIGLLPYFGFPTRYPIIDISLWRGEVYLLPGVTPMTSIFTNPNTLGFFAFVGVLSALTEYIYEKSRISMFILILNTFGLVLSNNRSGWLALTITLGIYIVYKYWGRSGVLIYIFSGLSVSVGFILMISGFLPVLDIFAETTLNNRRQRWIHSIQIFIENPIIGNGLSHGGTHNSYIRIFAALGSIGGIAYLLLSFGTLIQSAREIDGVEKLSLTIALAGFVCVQMFEGGGFIGVGIHSTLISITMGYYITGKVFSDNSYL